MIDLSEESNEENIATCVKYFTRMAKMNRECSCTSSRADLS
jgi:fructose-bisphosphate aldolase class II